MGGGLTLYTEPPYSVGRGPWAWLQARTASTPVHFGLGTTPKGATPKGNPLARGSVGGVGYSLPDGPHQMLGDH